MTTSSRALRDAVLAAVTAACGPQNRDQVSEHATLAGLRVSDEALPSLRAVSDLITHLSGQEPPA
jgi:hypothetical protein